MIVVGHLASCLILNEITSVQFSKVYILMVDGAMAPISFSVFLNSFSLVKSFVDFYVFIIISCL